MVRKAGKAVFQSTMAALFPALIEVVQHSRDVGRSAVISIHSTDRDGGDLLIGGLPPTTKEFQSTQPIKIG